MLLFAKLQVHQRQYNVAECNLIAVGKDLRIMLEVSGVKLKKRAHK